MWHDQGIFFSGIREFTRKYIFYSQRGNKHNEFNLGWKTNTKYFIILVRTILEFVTVG